MPVIARIGTAVIALAWAGAVAHAEEPAGEAPVEPATGTPEESAPGKGQWQKAGAQAVQPAGDAGDDAAVGTTDAAEPGDLDLRLTLSSFLYRESGDDAPPIVDGGATIENASPVRRYFGDLRLELAGGGLAIDTRVRQTSSQRYQSGAASGGEYDVRTLSFRIGSPRTALVLGRQFIDAVGSTKIDGLALIRRLTPTWSATAFGGGYPQLGSRSVDTDYPTIRNADGSEGSRLIPISAGLGAAYVGARVHGDLGLAAVYAPQDVPGAGSSESSRVFASASGYARPASWVDVYHLGLLDLAGGSGVNLTNGSLGLNVRPLSNVQLSASAHHVSTELLEIAARNVLEDPDPTALGIVQNNIAVIRVSQDLMRAGASVALAEQRFELSASGGLHRRPGVSVELPDGSGAVPFPLARWADATFSILDRRSIAGLRVGASAILTYPLGDNLPNRSRSTSARLVVSRTFSQERGELEVDVMGHRSRQVSGSGMCETSLEVFACYGSARVSATQAGVLGSWRAAREWLVLLDTHLGIQDVESTSINGQLAWPRVYSVTVFARAQWRYR